MTPNDPNLILRTQQHEEEEGPVGETFDSQKMFREKIIHVLSIYPRLSNSMLQVGVGTGIPPQLWKPILQSLIKEGVIIESSLSVKTPIDRIQSYTILTLAQYHDPINALTMSDRT